jgi:predicted Fe-S protein YdhL (DUF1289 family)
VESWCARTRIVCQPCAEFMPETGNWTEASDDCRLGVITQNSLALGCFVRQKCAVPSTSMTHRPSQFRPQHGRKCTRWLSHLLENASTGRSTNEP